MKEICKNCIHRKPTYKGGICEIKQERTKLQDTCDSFQPKDQEVNGWHTK